MESIESPLEVLSRAATMVQDLPNNSEDTSKSQKHQTKWKRDRRTRLPEYSRKESKSPEGVPDSARSIPSDPEAQTEVNRTEAPLDMSVRHRGLPPSYEKTIANPEYRGFRPSVIVGEGKGIRNELPSGISMCDPIIDEHFRRSLGKDYVALFQNNNKTSEPAPKSPPITKAAVQELIDMDNAGLSVDDHFAKALGDTWFKLNQKDTEIKNTNGNQEKQSVVSL